MKIESISIMLPEENNDIEKWDLEEWRKKYPMDYFKAVAMLYQSNNPSVTDVIFKILYKITRLHVPDVLYKYYSLTDNVNLNKKKLTTLCNKQIYMSELRDFNDPFDGKGFFYDPNQLADIKRLEERGGRIIEDFTSFVKTTCFTVNGVNSMPMWAHYGNNHRGFCVSYNKKNNSKLFSCVYPVQYTDERLDITRLVRKQAIEICSKIDANIKDGQKITVYNDRILMYVALLMYNVKHISWSYENEFRCSLSSKDSYFTVKPSEIYIGMNCDEKNIKLLEEIADYLEIPIYRMKFKECDDSYQLCADIHKY